MLFYRMFIYVFSHLSIRCFVFYFEIYIYFLCVWYTTFFVGYMVLQKLPYILTYLFTSFMVHCNENLNFHIIRFTNHFVCDQLCLVKNYFVIKYYKSILLEFLLNYKIINFTFKSLIYFHFFESCQVRTQNPTLSIEINDFFHLHLLNISSLIQ